MPAHGALYRSQIARLFRSCGKGKALYFEDTRLVMKTVQRIKTLGSLFVVFFFEILVSYLNFSNLNEYRCV